MLWFAFRDARRPLGWETSRFADFWNTFHGTFVTVVLFIAAILTIYSFAVYMYRYRRLISERLR